MVQIVIDQKIMITGGLGFIGSHVAEYFANLGYEVVLIDNLSRPGPNLHRNSNSLVESHMSDKNQHVSTQPIPYILQYFQMNHPLIKIYHDSVCDQDRVQQIILSEQPNFIVHAAGQTSAIGSFQSPYLDYENNLHGLINVLESVRNLANPPIFLYLSTNKVYGTSVNKIPWKETETRYEYSQTPFHGISEKMSIDQSKHSPYGISKLAGDLYTQEYGFSYNLPVGIFRMSCIYGDRQFGFTEQGWISHFVIQALKNQPIQIYGTGKQVRDVLFIDDLVSLIHQFFIQISKARNDGNQITPQVFNVGGGIQNAISLLELKTLMRDNFVLPLIFSFVPERPGDQKMFISDLAKVTGTFRWQPQISPNEGLKRVIDWTKSHLNLFQL